MDQEFQRDRLVFIVRFRVPQNGFKPLHLAENVALGIPGHGLESFVVIDVQVVPGGSLRPGAIGPDLVGPYAHLGQLLRADQIRNTSRRLRRKVIFGDTADNTVAGWTPSGAAEPSWK